MLGFEDENGNIVDKDFDMRIERMHQFDKYNAHFIKIRVGGMYVWSSFEQIIAFLEDELTASTLYVRADSKRLGFKRVAHVEYVFNTRGWRVGRLNNKNPNRRRIYTLSKFIDKFNSALHRSIVKEAKNIMKRRLNV